MADIVGVDGIHNISGLLCDLCGKECDSKVEELNFLTCASSCCPSEASMYHQHCIEKFLKQMRVERNRKTGFDCPRGKGKGTVYKTPCNGKIQKSHPVHIRNDDCANRKKTKPVEPPKPEFIPKRHRQKAAEAELQAKPKEQVQAKQKAAAADQPGKQPNAAESRHTGKVTPDLRRVPQGVRKPAQTPTPVRQPVEKKVLVVPHAEPQPSRDTLRAAKMATRRELGLPISPPNTAQQALRANGRGLRPAGLAQKAIAGATAAAAAWKNYVPKTASVMSTSPPVSTMSETDAGSSQNPDWTSQDESDVQTPRVQQSGQKQLQHRFVAKGTSSEAASSPMTPNAIKAFQPELSEHGDENQGSVTTPSAQSLLGLQQDTDTNAEAESFCTDADQDGFFCTEAGSSSGGPELYLLDRVVSDGTSQVSPDLHDGVISTASWQQQQFLDVVAMWKAKACAAQYQMLGFSKQQGVAAVNKFGSNMQFGLAWLLEAPESYFQGIDPHEPRIDITEDLQDLKTVQQAIGMSENVLHQIAIHSASSMRSVKAAMLQWAQLHNLTATVDASQPESPLPSLTSEGSQALQGINAHRAMTASSKIYAQVVPVSAEASAQHLVNQVVGFEVSRI